MLLPKAHLTYLLPFSLWKQINDQMIGRGDSHGSRDALKRSQDEEGVFVVDCEKCQLKVETPVVRKDVPNEETRKKIASVTNPPSKTYWAGYRSASRPARRRNLDDGI
jgi:hypothetical protein